jgi:hypothetical protein
MGRYPLRRPREARHALLDQLKVVRARHVESTIVFNGEVPADGFSPRLKSAANQALGLICHRLPSRFSPEGFGHRHSGIGLMTPYAVHYGLAPQILAARQATLLAAYARHPEGFVRRPPRSGPTSRA